MKGRKTLLLLTITILALAACGGTSESVSSFIDSENKSSEIISETSSSLEESSSVSSKSEEVSSQSSKESVSSSLISSSESISSLEESSSEVSSESSSSSSSTSIESSASENSSLSSQSFSDSSSPYTGESLSSNPQTCEDHVLEEIIMRNATIIQKGIKRKICQNCGGFTDEWIYDFDEFAFSDVTYMYDGKERSIFIDGMIPYGTKIVYENNSLTEIGEKEATAKIYDGDNNLLLTKTAKISIVENIGLPEIKVTTETGQDPDYKEKKNYTFMTTDVTNCPDKYKLTGREGGIRVRGNSTNQASVGKRAWRLKFDNKVNLLGLNSNKKFKSWVLLADYFDQSMFRNLTAFNMGGSLFNYSNNYTSHYQHVNFYMNGEYRGIYLLAEQQQANEGRIGLAEPENNTNTDVGYLLEIDGLITTGQSDEEYTFTTGSNNSSGGWGGGWGGFGGGDRINGVSVTDKGYAVKTDIFGDEQFPFIKNYINNVLTLFKNAVRNDDQHKLQVLDANNNLIDSPYDNQYETLNAVMDLDSMFKTYVLQEFVKNYDCGWGSFYLFVDFSSTSKHHRLTLGAPWDFDLGSGNKKSGNGVKTNDNFLNGSYTGMTEFNPWLYLLSQADFFPEMFAKYYSIFVNSGIYERTIDFVNYESNAFAEAFAASRECRVWQEGDKTSMQTRQYDSHKEAVDYLLNWYKERKTYLDNKYLK